MDGKRHPSSFQQLEKLGEGTYATVRLACDSGIRCNAPVSFMDSSTNSLVSRCLKAEIDRPESWLH
jgi:hypothetical protein